MRARRKALDITQGQLAKDSGVSPSAIAALETREDYQPSLPVQKALAQALACRLEWLINGKGEISDPNRPKFTNENKVTIEGIGEGATSYKTLSEAEDCKALDDSRLIARLQWTTSKLNETPWHSRSPLLTTIITAAAEMMRRTKERLK